MIKLKRFGRFFLRNPIEVKKDIRRFAINKFLYFYDNWVLPPQNISLLELKLKEFEDRKKLIHPYTKESFIADSLQSDKILNLEKKTKMSNMHTFTLTYDRHEGRYDWKEKDFPDKYSFNDSPFEYLKDPDWRYKMRRPPISIKKWIIINLLAFIYYYVKMLRVKKFDADFRKEQRSMQNKDLQGIEDKTAIFRLRDKQDEVFTDYGPNYIILWYDAKMANYINLIKELPRKRIATERLLPILVIDEQGQMDKILDLRTKATTVHTDVRPNTSSQASAVNDNLMKQFYEKEQLKKDLKASYEFTVLRRDDYTSEEKIARTMDKSIPKDEDAIYLELKKNCFYVLDKDMKIVDCAHIYSFTHEDLIYNRIMARINRHIDSKFKYE